MFAVGHDAASDEAACCVGLCGRNDDHGGSAAALACSCVTGIAPESPMLVPLPALPLFLPALPPFELPSPAAPISAPALPPFELPLEPPQA